MTDFHTEDSSRPAGARRMTDTTTVEGQTHVPEAWPDGEQTSGPEIDFSTEALVSAAARFRERVHVLRDRRTGDIGATYDDGAPWALDETHGLVATLPPIYPEWLGSRGL